ncbi:MAG: hypothetical protein ACRD08_05830, partial [Acidimicrobiales bacterium]
PSAAASERVGQDTLAGGEAVGVGAGGADRAQQPGGGFALLVLAFQLAGAEPQPGQLEVAAGGQRDA